MANQPKTLLVGPPNTILQNVVHALPGRLVFVKSDVAVEVCDTVDGVFAALTGANTTGVNTASGFIQCPTGTAIVRCKA